MKSNIQSMFRLDTKAKIVQCIAYVVSDLIMMRLYDFAGDRQVFSGQRSRGVDFLDEARVSPRQSSLRFPSVVDLIRYGFQAHEGVLVAVFGRRDFISQGLNFIRLTLNTRKRYLVKRNLRIINRIVVGMLRTLQRTQKYIS